MARLGADVARWQPIDLPWAAWVAGGLSVAVVQVTHGTAPEPHASEHLAAAVAAHVPAIGAYHWLMPGNTRAQLARFIDKVDEYEEITFCALDVEEPGLAAQDVLDFCNDYDQYDNPPLVLYGNNMLALFLTARPELKRYGVWWAEYGPMLPGCQQPPYAHPHVPAGLRVVAWQYAGDNGVWPPYAGGTDRSVWYEIPGAKPVSVPVITRGPKLGIHSIQPGNTLALVQKALDHGWHWPLVKILHDASVAADVKRLSPETLTIVRYMPASADDEGLQNVDQWSLSQMRDWAVRLIALIFARTAAEHLPAVDYWDVTNEPGAHGVGYYRALGLAFIELVTEADRRGVHLSLPALPQGTPEWDEMIALTNTGLFGLMKAGGHIWDSHEGAFVDQPIDFGFGDVIPGAPKVDGAGSTSFRHRYLYRLLEQRGEVVPLVISEFYGGGRYSNPPADQLERFKWFDVRARQEYYLLAFLPFTVNPDGGWANADYGPTYASPELWQWIDAEKDKLNGDDEMQPLYHARPLQDLLLRDAQGQPVTDPIAPSGAVLKGTLVHVYKENVTAGAYQNRAVVTPDGKNIWSIATALQRA